MEKDIFTEYKLDWFVKDKLEEMTHDKLIKILKFIRLNNIKRYTISGLTKHTWKVLIKIG